MPRRGGRLYLLVPTLLQAFGGVPTEDPAGAWRRGCGWAWFGAEGLQGQLNTEAGHLPWVRLLASSSGAGPLGRRPSGRGTPGTSRERGQRLGARGWVSGRHSSVLRLHMGDPWVRSARVKIRGHQGPRQVVSQESPQLNPVHGAHCPASVCLRPQAMGWQVSPFSVQMVGEAPTKAAPREGVLAWRCVCRALGTRGQV